MKYILLAILALGAQAFLPASAPKLASTVRFAEGKYDGQMWNMDAKMDIFNAFDPETPRAETNFNPFEQNSDGNSCDCSGYFPGEGKYKDPQRPDMNFAKMMEEKEIMEKVKADPKMSATGILGSALTFSMISFSSIILAKFMSGRCGSLYLPSP